MADGEKNEVKYRVSRGDEFMLVILAFIFWVVGLIPFVNVISDVLATVTFFCIFNFLLGVPTFGPRTWTWFVAAFLIDLIPIASWIPIVIVMVIRLSEISRMEDRLAASGIGAAALQTQKVKNIMQGVLKSKKIAERENQASLRRDGTRDTGRQQALNNRRQDAERSLKEPFDPKSRQDYLTGGDFDSKRYLGLDRFAKPANYGPGLPSGSASAGVDGIKPPANDNAPAAEEAEAA